MKQEQREYNKKYYLKNKEKIKRQSKKWKEENPERFRELMKKNYLKNYDKIRIAHNERAKRLNYIEEKTPEQRKLRYIKRETRRLFPLFKVIKCNFCDNGATEHHHNTNPITFDNFNYACHNCHRNQHKFL